eukprot:SM000023S07649  [mRNA]  locus=s23:587534:590408:- [translate_table: standard]
MAPIGHLRSCFTTRNGTPRQPLLVPLARAELRLAPGGVPPAALDGLGGYSHCWLLYVFHANTDLPRIWKRPAHRGVRAKVQVPRLNGEKVGVFATRSPHRPVPIGLSLAKVTRKLHLEPVATIEAVEGDRLLLSGIDVVDGTPILDVKPYLPYSDSLPSAITPAWVQAEGTADPLCVADVDFTAGFQDQLAQCWAHVSSQSLYTEPQELQCLVSQVLARDIRSVHQRQQQGCHSADGSHESFPTPACTTTQPEACGHDGKHKGPADRACVYHLVIEQIAFAYTIDPKGRIPYSATNDCHKRGEAYAPAVQVAGLHARALAGRASNAAGTLAVDTLGRLLLDISKVDRNAALS